MNVYPAAFLWHQTQQGMSDADEISIRNSTTQAARPTAHRRCPGSENLATCHPSAEIRQKWMFHALIFARQKHGGLARTLAPHPRLYGWDKQRALRFLVLVERRTKKQSPVSSLAFVLHFFVGRWSLLLRLRALMAEWQYTIDHIRKGAHEGPRRTQLFRICNTGGRSSSATDLADDGQRHSGGFC